MRTRRTYITSLGDQIESEYDLPFQTPSVAALEYISEGQSLEHYSTNIIGDIIPLSPRTGSFIDMSYSDSAELNNLRYYAFINWGTVFIANAYYHTLFPASQVPELYFFKDASNTSRDRLNVVLTSSLFPNQNTSDPSSLRVKPGFIFEHPSFL
jgi:hypothetical protein